MVPARLMTVALSLIAALAAGTACPRAARAEDPLSPAETAKKESIERLEKDLRRMANSPRAEKQKDEIVRALESLGVLGGPEAGKASLPALAFDDEDVEKAVMKVVEANHAKSLVAPLGAIIENKDTRRRFRLHALLAHAFQVIADPIAMEPLTALVESEDAHVVAAAAEALATFKTASHAKRVEPVKRLLEVFETTWNLKESIRPEDRVARDHAKGEWEVYGAAVKKALQALTGQDNLVRARQFRDWWNDHKHDANW